MKLFSVLFTRRAAKGYTLNLLSVEQPVQAVAKVVGRGRALDAVLHKALHLQIVIEQL